jgi:hypothetical protein
MVMLKADNRDYPLDTAQELQEVYPDEVLESEWNPVIAKLQRLKKQGGLQQQSAISALKRDWPDHTA